MVKLNQCQKIIHKAVLLLYNQINVIKAAFLDLKIILNGVAVWNFETLILHQITGGLSNILARNYKIKPDREPFQIGIDLQCFW